MKALRVDHVVDPFTVTGKRSQTSHKTPRPSKNKTKRKKKKRGIAYYLKDMAEDVFDIFD